MSLGPSAFTKQTQRVVLRDSDGKALHFDVSVDFVAIATELQNRARGNRSYRAVVAGGAVRVEYVL